MHKLNLKTFLGKKSIRYRSLPVYIYIILYLFFILFTQKNFSLSLFDYF